MSKEKDTQKPPYKAESLNKEQQDKWDTFVDSVKEIGQAKTEDDIKGALAQMQQTAINISPEESKVALNALHIPKDAGEYADALRGIMERIPDGWGRWIDCGKGWYPLIVELDARLAEIDPDYEVHQAKEKYGSLRYYTSTKGTESFDGPFFDLIRGAERRSESICEICGSDKGVLCQRGSWLKTLCPECATQNEYSVHKS